MRIASKIGFGERPSDTRTLVKRYFMAFEGKIDEFNYFTGLFYHLRKKHVHHPFIEIIAFKRSPEHNGHSNPLSVVKQIEMAITTGKVDSNIRYQEVVEEFLASVDDGTIRGKQRSAYYEFAQKTLSKENLSLSDIAETTMLNTLVTNLYSRHTQSLTSKEGVLTLEEIILAYQDRDGIHYDENLDEVCIIVDRDQASFTAQQYDEVLACCKERGYHLYVSNPCFEFFLLLHKTDGTELSSKQLLNNPKEGKFTYVTQRLREVFPSYKKGNVRFIDFENDLFAVIKNAQIYATSLEDLKNKVGTNLSEFLQIFIST